jgi:uncharacterized protein with PhoU and TrkA domain
MLAGAADEVTVLAIKRGKTMTFRPIDTIPLEAGDELVAAGPSAAIRTLEARLQK